MHRSIHRSYSSSNGLLIALAAALALSASAGAHDMFLIVPDHHLASHAEATVALYNGTFQESLNTIDRERMLDVSVVDGAGKQSHPAPSQWRDEGNESLLTFTTGLSGSYLVGVSTAPRVIELSAEDFNEYLSHDGVLDVLEQRKRGGQLDKPARERYSKHVKTVLQVGDVVTDHHTELLGYPIEIVPQTNPSLLRVGATFKVLVLANGSPAAQQLVYASYEGHHAHDDEGGHDEAVSTRTDARGLAEIEITQPGRWYIRLIRMVEVFDGDVDYESNWATLTFQVD